MFQKTNEIKVLRDPIHGYIHISYPYYFLRFAFVFSYYLL